MGADIIDGKAFAARTRARVAEIVAELGVRASIVPGLAVVLVGEDPASEVYVRSKGKQTREIGMHSEEHRLAATASEGEVLGLVARLNHDPAIHGILVQLPLPAQIDTARVLDAVAPEKDVDGFHVLNAGRLAIGQPAMVPCTPLGCLMLLRDRLGDLAGLDAVVVGRSNIVGKPMAQLLLRENCTVTVAHSRSRELPAIAARARHPRRGGGAAGAGDRGLGEAGGDGDRRRDHPGGAAGRPDRPGRRRRFRERFQCRRRDHAGAGRGRADDDRLPAGQYADRLLPDQRAAGAGGADGLISKVNEDLHHMEPIWNPYGMHMGSKTVRIELLPLPAEGGKPAARPESRAAHVRDGVSQTR